MNLYSREMKQNNPLLYKYFKEILSYLMTVESASAQDLMDISGGMSYGTWKNGTWKRLRELGLVEMIPPKRWGMTAHFKIPSHKRMYVQEILDTYGERVDLSIEEEVNKMFNDKD